MLPSIRGKWAIGTLFLYLALTNVAASEKEDVASSPGLSTPEECARDCTADPDPRVCYYHFTIEMYSILSGACDLCTPNNTGVTNDCQCVLADGVQKSVMVVNRRLPGPSIEVCLGDKVIVDVENLAAGMETSIHWHGLYQHGTPFFDGVPYVTQCPIAEGTTFRYEFFARNAGTHFWHAHSGLQELDGLFGALIIREKKTSDPHSHLYDHDLTGHVMVVNDWMHEQANSHLPGLRSRSTGQFADSLLVNGMGQWKDPITQNVTNTPLPEFAVESGKVYRFRVIGALATVCYAQITIEGHNLTVIAMDGEPVEPATVNSLHLFAGERYDFLINATQLRGTYWIQVRALGECSEDKVQQLAILRYDNTFDDFTPEPTYEKGLATGVVMNPVDGHCDGIRKDAVCVSNLRRAGDFDDGILGEPDVKLTFEYQFFFWKLAQLYKPGNYHAFLKPKGSPELVSTINNIMFHEPSSPPLTQSADLDPSLFCNKDNLPADCGTPCACTHVIDIPLNSIVQIILFDKVGQKDLHHPWHLHGHAFYVMAMGKTSYDNGTKVDVEAVLKMDKEGLFDGNADYPPAKDTIAVPSNGYAVIRFRANNPGYWIMHCHFVYHMGIGMDFVLHVGNSTDLPKAPKNFPTCGNYLPKLTYGDDWLEYNPSKAEYSPLQ